MPAPLATTADLEDVWRPLDSTEIDRAKRLIDKASARLRQKAPSVDARIAAFKADPTDLSGLDPSTVADVVATIVKRFLSNVDGVTSKSLGGASVTYAMRGDKDIRGEMNVTDADLAALAPARTKKGRIGNIKVRPNLAPWPWGRLGVAGGGSSVGDSWLAEIGQDFPASEFPISSIPYAGDS